MKVTGKEEKNEFTQTGAGGEGMRERRKRRRKGGREK